MIANRTTSVLEQRGAMRLASGDFQTDRTTDPLLSDTQLRALAGTPDQELTYTCIAPGDGVRVGVDRDEDGCPDRSELDAGTDPANPLSVPPGCSFAVTTTTSSTTTSTTAVASTTTSSTTSTTMAPLTLIETRSLKIKDDANPARRRFTFKSSTSRDPAANGIVPPAPGSTGDPTLNGGELIVYNAAGLTTDSVAIPLLSGWTPIGKAPAVKGWRFKSTDSSSGVSSVEVQADKISVKGGTAAFGYTLNEPAQGSVGVRLLLGPGGWCADGPAKTSGNPPSTARNDTVDRFIAEPRSPAPSTCPGLPQH